MDTREDALRQVDSLVTRVEAGGMSGRMDLTLLFAPTGNIQEVALSSGWGREFLALAERFDAVIDRVLDEKPSA